MKSLVEKMIDSLKKHRKSKSKNKPITMSDCIKSSGFGATRIIVINGIKIDPNSEIGKKVISDMDAAAKRMDGAMESANKIINNAMNMMDEIFKSKERSEK